MTVADGGYRLDGRPVRLAERLGRGGEGEVFALAEAPETAVKLYAPEAAARRADKIAAMVAARFAGAAPFVAFPRALVHDGRGRFAGFSMARVTAAEPLHEVYAPGPRKERFPDADYRFLVRVALNVARAVAATHATGCVIGDVNHSGFLIGPDGRVTLIDADSFAFAADGVRHPCHVGVPEYTAPELSGRSLAGVDRTVDHDAFALAVVLFQLLFMGRHPFAGVSSAGHVTVPEAIAAHRFPYDRTRETGLSPPPGAPRLQDVPAPLAALFEAAFAPDAAGHRPAASAWVAALEDLEARLRPCAESLRHHFADGAPGCPWCRLEAASGTPLFLLPDAVLGRALGLPDLPPLPPFDGAGVRARLAAAAPPESFRYDPPAPLARDVPAPPRRSRWPDVPRLLGGLVLLAIGLVNIGLIPQNWLMSVPVLLGGFAWARDSVRPDRQPRAELLEVDSRLSRALRSYQAGVDIDGAALLAAEVEGLVAARETLPTRLADEERRFQEERVLARRAAYMARIRLREAAVPGLTADGLARLEAAGVRTAADAAAADLRAVPDLDGAEAEALAAFVRGALSGFRPDAAFDEGERAEFAARHAALVATARDLDERLPREARRLEALTATIEAARTAREPAIDHLLARRASLVAEIEALGKAAPARPVQPSKRLSEETRRRARALRTGTPPSPA